MMQHTPYDSFRFFPTAPTCIFQSISAILGSKILALTFLDGFPSDRYKPTKLFPGPWPWPFQDNDQAQNKQTFALDHHKAQAWLASDVERQQPKKHEIKLGVKEEDDPGSTVDCTARLRVMA